MAPYKSGIINISEITFMVIRFNLQLNIAKLH